jgi:myo-inositol-1-phosphate synthase
MDQALAVMKDIADFKAKHKLERVTMIWCASTEAYCTIHDEHKSLAAFEEGLRNNSPHIPPSMIYAYAALNSGAGYANGAPNLTTDCPAILELANAKGLPVSGKDFKTGQTLIKTIIAPGIRARYLGIAGWYSTNILGNRDGEVLDDPENFKTKEVSKLSVLETILQPHLYPDLYANLYHKVQINYYPPRGDNKEGWDNIDLVGWLGMPMQLKINFLCRDSILAAPLVLDLVLFMDLAQRAGLKGIQEWLSFFYKSPMVKEGLYPENHLFIQEIKLKNTLRYLMGEDQITHLGMDYYES